MPVWCWCRTVRYWPLALTRADGTYQIGKQRQRPILRAYLGKQFQADYQRQLLRGSGGQPSGGRGSGAGERKAGDSHVGHRHAAPRGAGQRCRHRATQRRFATVSTWSTHCARCRGSSLQQGQYGGLTSIFIRGSNSNANQVNLDGVPIADIGGRFDFSNLVHRRRGTVRGLSWSQ